MLWSILKWTRENRIKIFLVLSWRKVKKTMAFGSTQSEVGIIQNVWIGDTGASSHMTNSKEGLRNMRPIKSSIIFGNGQRLQNMYVGDKYGTAVRKDGMRTWIVIKDVKYVPELFCNLFSIPMALRNRYTLEGSRDKLIIRKDKKKFFHKILDHASEAMTRSTASKMNTRVKGDYTYCDGCSQGKMRQKNISKCKWNKPTPQAIDFFWTSAQLNIKACEAQDSGYWSWTIVPVFYQVSFFLKKNQIWRTKESSC